MDTVENGKNKREAKLPVPNLSPGAYRARVLAVDDEPAILLGLTHELTTYGFEVKTAADGQSALNEIEQYRPDLVILDLMMPIINGLEVIRRTRELLHNDVPIIVLSARGEERQKVEALDLGANDYLTKPFGMDELLARVRVSLRSRQYTSLVTANPSLERFNQAPSVTGNTETAPHLLGNAQLMIDLDKHLVLRQGVEIKLTPRQFKLLTFLALNPDKLLTHRLILHNIWGAEHQRQTEYLHVFIGQLRQKLEPNPAKPRFILTEPGLGYRFKSGNPA